MNKRDREMAEAIERAEADEEHEDATRTYGRPAPPRQPSQVYTVRVPVDRLEVLRRVASDRGENPSTLMREWVLERLDTEVAGRPPIDEVLEAVARDVSQLRRDVEGLTASGARTRAAGTGVKAARSSAKRTTNSKPKGAAAKKPHRATQKRRAS